MHSIRAKSIILNLASLVTAITVIAIISSVSVANFGHESAEQSLMLQCEKGKNSLNYYFKSAEQSLNSVSGLIDADLSDISDSDFNTEFHNHVERSKIVFGKIAEHTNGVLTYYYRMDPDITTQTGELGYWFVDLEGEGFESHEVTDLTDESKNNPWFKVPKEEGKAVWVPPYYTTGLDNIYVVSYNVPITRGDIFIGVAGIEIHYKTLGEQISNIKVLQSGYAYIIESNHGTIIYHPRIDLTGLSDDERPKAPQELLDGLAGTEHHIHYVYKGVEKHAYWLNLGNDMTIVVAVPFSEVNGIWAKLLLQIIVAATAIIVVVSVLTIIFTRRITKPLKELTTAAERINNGDYNVSIDYKGDDEIGVLTTTVNKLVKHLDSYISDLNALAHSDALTDVKNKSSFDEAINDLQARLDRNNEFIEFAIVIFDVDDLKPINDNYGHDKGNIVLINASNLMRRVFQKSTIYRVGGDEFAVKKSAEICSFAKEPWEKIKVSIGIATYDPDVDETVKSVLIHADHLMYENKRARKKGTNK